jgi:YVTN family beta-propeller protein
VPELHGGTVTFLFTDIEGSTQLLKELGNGYADVLGEHQRILRAAFAAHGGQEVDTQGDSFFVAFRTANDAVAAAVDAQRDLEAHGWPEGTRVRVRMGLHTGEPKVGGERYVGIGVHRAARIGAAGHGGQVLLSSTTKELAEEDLPPGVTIRDLGERRLKDLDQRQRLYQLVIEGLPSEFSPLRTLDVELKRKRRRMYAGAALIGVAAAAVAIPVFALGQGGSGGSDVTVAPNSVAVIDPRTNRVMGDVPVGTRPAEIVSGSGSLWVANLDDETVSRIDPTTSRVIRYIHDPGVSGSLAAAPGATWAMTADPAGRFVTATKIDPSYDAITQKIKVKTQAQFNKTLPAVAVGEGAVWVGPPGWLLTRIDPATSSVKTIDTGNGPSSVAVGEGGVWVADVDANNVVRVDPTSNILADTIPVGHAPAAIAVGAGSVWVADRFDNEVVRIDPSTNAVKSTIQVGDSPVGIAVGGGGVWVANSGDGTVSRIDPKRNAVVKTITVGGSPHSIEAGAGGRIWVSVQARAPLAPAKAGGTLRIVGEGDVDYMDPALAYGTYSWPLELATCAKLLTYPDKPGPAGAQLVPEVAIALPKRSADGKTYTFTIRNGFRFSPPSNAPVTAQTFKDTIERTLNPKMKSPGLGFAKDIVGETAYAAGKARHISGISVRGNTLAIRLTDNKPDFLARIAMPFFCAAPSRTPIDPRGVRLVPSAGPYYVSSYIPGQGVVLKRNPNYTGGRPHHLEEIDFTPNVPRTRATAEIEAGRIDYSIDGVPADQQTRLRSRYGPGSQAAKVGRQQYFVSNWPALGYLALNTSRPLFADVRLRKAVNYAIDRRAIARLQEFGITNPTDQYLLPSLPGFHDVHIYPLVPDVARARRLAAGRHGTAILYTGTVLLARKRAAIIKANLKAIGIDVEVKNFPGPTFFERISTRGEPFDIADDGWIIDYIDPADFLNVLLDGRSIQAKGNTNHAYFDDPAYNRKLDAASKLTGPRRYRAYAKLDADLARSAAPWVAISTGLHPDLYSARIGCQVGSPLVWGPILSALCIRGHARR